MLRTAAVLKRICDRWAPQIAVESNYPKHIENKSVFERREGMNTEVNLRISKHAYDRMKERLGMNKKAAQRIAQKALSNGIGREETSGCLQRYIETLSLLFCM